jgi:hypothetical protein
MVDVPHRRRRECPHVDGRVSKCEYYGLKGELYSIQICRISSRIVGYATTGNLLMRRNCRKTGIDESIEGFLEAESMVARAPYFWLELEI